jgi:hypothetical protein
MAANLPLAFGEILVGGILIVMGWTGDTLSQVVKGDIQITKATTGSLAGAVPSASAASAGGSGGGGGGGVPPSNLPGASLTGSGVTPTSFAVSLLKGIGAPITPANVQSLITWQRMEGGNWNNTARYNPLNTTQSMPGSYNPGFSAGVQAYNSWQQGLDATIKTLSYPAYSDIISTLKAGNGLHGNISGLSTWSGGGYSSIP